MGRRQLHDAAGTGQVSHARFGAAGGRQRPDRVHRPDRPRARAARRGESPPPTTSRPAGSLLFRYPTDEDPCILVRDAAGRFDAFSQVCTHLSCAVVHRPGDDVLACPCHKGSFSAREGLPVAGPPTRRLPRIRDRAARRRSRGDGRRGVSVETRQQGSILFSAVLVLIALARGDPVVARRRGARRAVCAAVRRPRADGRRVGRAVRVERRIALVRGVVRRPPPPVGPA